MMCLKTFMMINNILKNLKGIHLFLLQRNWLKNKFFIDYKILDNDVVLINKFFSDLNFLLFRKVYANRYGLGFFFTTIAFIRNIRVKRCRHRFLIKNRLKFLFFIKPDQILVTPLYIALNISIIRKTYRNYPTILTYYNMENNQLLMSKPVFNKKQREFSEMTES